MSRYPLNLYRMAFGRAHIAASAANFSLASFFNISTGPYYAVVHDISVTDPSTGGVSLAVAAALPSGASTQFTPSVPTEGAPAVVWQASNPAVVPNAQYTLGSAVTAYTGWFHDYPLLSLPPGWSLQLFTQAVNLALTVGVLVQFVTAEQMAQLQDMPEGDPFPRDRDY